MKHYSRRLSALLLALLLLFSSAYADSSDAINILLIGVDSRTEELVGRSDTMLLVRVDPNGNTVRMVSFLRDLYVDIPEKGNNRLNAAYRYGGEELLKQTLKQNFDVEVDRTVTVQFSTLVDLIDQLDGIDVEITESERKQLNKVISEYNASNHTSIGSFADAGLQHMNGIQALEYSRIRKIDNDFNRTSRQQTVLYAMMRQASTKSYWELFTMALANLSSLQTDLAMSDIISLLPLAGRLNEITIETTHVPFEGTYVGRSIDGASVLVPDLEACVAQLKDFLTD